MLQPSPRELDPTLFQKGPEHEAAFAAAITETATLLESSSEIVRKFEGYDRASAVKGEMAELEEEHDESYEGLLESLGDNDETKSLIGMVLGAVNGPGISQEEYDQAKSEREEASTTLVDYVCGYQAHMSEGLAAAFGEDTEAVAESAWKATWTKVRDILAGDEGTLLAETAGFFDGIVREKYGKSYRHIERDRGPAVNQDPCARAFYKVMEDHLHRAIVGSNRDEWTGYK
jgi:hypothetical protein